MKYIISEIQYKNLSEQVEQYDELDYYDVFFKTFKKYLQEKKGLDVEKFPMSYLLKKYIKDFIADYELSGFDDDWDDDFQIRTWSAHRWGRDLIEKGVVTIPSMRPEGTFMSKYSKFVDLFTKKLNLPDYVKLEINEPESYVLEPSLIVDWEKVMKSPEKVRVPSRGVIIKELKSFLQNYMGFEIDSPFRGGVSVERATLNDLNYDVWMKNEITKKIKPEIKKLPNANQIKAIRTEYSSNSVELKIIFYNNYGFNYSQKRALRDQANALLEELGYNTKHISVSY